MHRKLYYHLKKKLLQVEEYNEKIATTKNRSTWKTLQDHAETEVDDLLDDIKDRTKGQSSFIPDIFKQDLNTSMPTNIGTRTQNINPLSGLTRTQELLLSPEEKLIAARK